jgi:hypothetical protein
MKHWFSRGNLMFYKLPAADEAAHKAAFEILRQEINDAFAMGDLRPVLTVISKIEQIRRKSLTAAKNAGMNPAAASTFTAVSFCNELTDAAFNVLWQHAVDSDAMETWKRIVEEYKIGQVNK